MALDALGIDENLFAPSYLRAGGATQAFIAESNLDKLQFAGRWKHASTLHHIQGGLAAMSLARLSLGSAALVAEAAGHFDALWAAVFFATTLTPDAGMEHEVEIGAKIITGRLAKTMLGTTFEAAYGDSTFVATVLKRATSDNQSTNWKDLFIFFLTRRAHGIIGL